MKLIAKEKKNAKLVMTALFPPLMQSFQNLDVIHAKIVLKVLKLNVVNETFAPRAW